MFMKDSLKRFCGFEMIASFLLLLGAATFASAADDCYITFINTEATVTFLRGQRRLILNRCAGAEIVNAVEIKVQDVELSVIHTHAVKSIPTLETVIFDNCKVYKMFSYAMWDLPNLKTIKIVNNPLGLIASKVFSNLTVENMELTGNQLVNVARDAFSGSENLRSVKLNKNELSHFFPEWFISSKNTLTQLDLSHNRISYIPISADVTYDKLETLLLNNNRIRSLNADVFKGLTKMKLLDLSHNRITEIFRYLTHPFSTSRITVKLNNNHLNYLIEDTLRTLQYGKIYLHSNPWKCACYKRISEWAIEYDVNIILSSDCRNNELFPICIEQFKYPKKCTQEVDHNITTIYYQHYNKVPCF